MKTEWLVADVTAVESIDRAERAILGVFMTGRAFWPIQSIFCWIITKLGLEIGPTGR